MPDHLQEMKDQLLVNESRLTDQLVNQLLILTCIIMTFGIIFIQFRSQEFSRSLRDWIQIGTYSILLLSAIRRHHLSNSHKLVILIGFMLVNGVYGIYTLGFFGSAIFLFPLSSIFAAMFFSRKALFFYGGFCILILVSAALSFILGFSTLENANEFIVSPLTWTVYIIGFSFLVVVSSYAVYRYRHAHELLMEEVSKQRDTLSDKTDKLEKALKEIQTLHGVIPICSYCHKIRNDAGAWDQLEVYISERSNAQFSHGICPPCREKVEEEFLNK